MRHPRIIIAGLSLAALATAGGITAAVASGSPAVSPPPAGAAPAGGPATAAATVRTAQVLVGGKAETILVNERGLPLYYYRPDTAARSLVSGGLLALWPALTSATPTAAELSGQLAAVMDTHGSQVAYNGHLLYTFTADQPGQVTGQGVSDFFVATPGLAPISGSLAPTQTNPSSPASGGYGY